MLAANIAATEHILLMGTRIRRTLKKDGHGLFCWRIPGSVRISPPAGREDLFFCRHVHVQARHGLAQALAGVCNHRGTLEMVHRLDDHPGPLCRVRRLEYCRADKDTVSTKLHHERAIDSLPDFRSRQRARPVPRSR